MAGTASAAQTTPGSFALSRVLTPVAVLLAISAFINYIDRGSLSLAVPLLRSELGLSPWQIGILLSSFFWTYTSFQIVSGWLVDRFNVNWVLAGGFFIWTMATAATSLVHGFQMLLVMRLILGAGESVAFPSYSKILAKHFPESLRGRAN
jgi:ACS family D-galactonate transporter-like MFS transporter